MSAVQTSAKISSPEQADLQHPQPMTYEEFLAWADEDTHAESSNIGQQ